MADLPVQPVQNYGELLSAYGNGLANIDNAVSTRLNAQSNAMQVPSTIAARNAGIAKTQTETTGLDLGNQAAAMKLTALQNYLQSLKQTDDSTASGVNPGGDNEKGEQNALTGTTVPGQTAGPATSAGTGQSAGGGQVPQGQDKSDPTFHDDDEASARMDNLMDAKYRVNKAFTPSEQRRFDAATALAAVTGDNSVVENAQKVHDQRVFNQTAAVQKEAQKHFDSSYTVATAPPGRAYDFMHDIDPNFAEHAAKVHGADPDHPEKWTAEQKTGIDSDIRKFATMANEKLTQYTGDTYEGKEGSLRNSRTLLPPIGGGRQSLTPQQRAALVSTGMAVDTAYPDGHGGTISEVQYRKEGFHNLDQYIDAHAKAAVGESVSSGTTAGRQSTNSDGQPSPTNSGVPGAPGAPGQPAVKAHPDSVINAANTGPIQGRNPNDPAIIRNEQDPTLRNALRTAGIPQEKGGYGISQAIAGKGQPGTTLPADLQKRQQATEDARTKLLADSGQAISTSGQALQYMNAAKTLLDHPETLQTGPMAKYVAQLSAIFPGQHIDATNYQEVAKYLMNAAIQQGNSNFTRGLTDKDTTLQTQQLSPNVDMTSQAARNLIEGNIRNTQFSLDSANRVKKFLAAGGDPQLFPDWNQATFNRAKTVNGPEGKPEAAPLRPGQEKSGEAAAVEAPKGVATPKSQAEYDALPKGAHYMFKGKERVKN